MTNLYACTLTALLAGVQFFVVLPAIAQDGADDELKEVCAAKQSGVEKEKYLSEYPSQEDVEKASGEKKSELKNLLADKSRVSKIWDNCDRQAI